MNDRVLGTQGTFGTHPEADPGASLMLGMVLLAIFAGAALALLAIILGLGLFGATIVFSSAGVLTLMLSLIRVSRCGRLDQTEPDHPNQTQGNV